MKKLLAMLIVAVLAMTAFVAVAETESDPDMATLVPTCAPCTRTAPKPP